MYIMFLFSCWVLAGLVLLGGTTPAAFAQEEEKPWSVTLDATYATKYIWRGFDVYDGDGAFQPSLDVSLYGFGLNVWGSFATNAGHEDLDEVDFTAYWNHSFFSDRPYALDFYLNYIYYDFPNVDSEPADTQEVGGGIALPNILAFGSVSLTPSYYLGYLWKAHSGGPEDGYFHVLGLSADMELAAIIPGSDGTGVSLYGDLTYNSGAFGVESGFSHATIGVSANVDFAGLYISPSANYQFSMEDTVNDENDAWFTISIGLTF